VRNPQGQCPGPDRASRGVARSGVPSDWTIEQHLGTAAEHVAWPAPGGRTVRLLEVTRPVLLLGSSQPAGDADEAAAARTGVEVARRRSGGGAVLVAAGQALWWDVFIPATDPLWNADVGRAFHWLGQAFVEALRAAGLAATWHDGPMLHTAWSRRVCFAGLGPGEVLVDGRKAVGLSQRRTRATVLFQCCVMLRWDPGPLLDLLALEPAERAEGAGTLPEVAVGIGPERETQLRRAFLEALAGR
jgi:lipoate---protein ligase